MRSRVLRLLKRGALLLAVIAITLIAVRIYDTQRGPPLELWHTYAPPGDERGRARCRRIGASTSPPSRRPSTTVRPRSRQLEAEDRVPVNRYFEGSPVLSRPVRAGLEPFLRAGAGGRAGRRGGVPARADGFALQPAAHRAPLSRPRLCRDRDQAARPRHRAGRVSRRSSGRTGWPPRASPCAKRAGGSARRCRCTWSASPTAARWP